jgi:effector-binding domain-containing protein
LLDLDRSTTMRRSTREAVMDYTVRVVSAPEQRTAVVAAVVTWPEFRMTWRGMLDEVYAAVHSGAVVQDGQNVMVFLDDRPSVEVGVEVGAPFPAVGRVVCSALPTGRAAMTVHRGPYDGLEAAHGAVRRWCRAEGHTITGVRWEVYGDWHESPDQLETAVYYSLLGPAR